MPLLCFDLPSSRPGNFSVKAPNFGDFPPYMTRIFMSHNSVC